MRQQRQLLEQLRPSAGRGRRDHADKRCLDLDKEKDDLLISEDEKEDNVFLTLACSTSSTESEIYFPGDLLCVQCSTFWAVPQSEGVCAVHEICPCITEMSGHPLGYVLGRLAAAVQFVSFTAWTDCFCHPGGPSWPPLHEGSTVVRGLMLARSNASWCDKVIVLMGLTRKVITTEAFLARV